MICERDFTLKIACYFYLKSRSQILLRRTENGIFVIAKLEFVYVEPESLFCSLKCIFSLLSVVRFSKLEVCLSFNFQN